MTTRVVGDVAVRVGADVGPLKVGLQDAGRRVDRFGRRGRNMGAAIRRGATIAATAITALAGSIAAAAARSISAMDSIGKKADQIGLAVEAFQELRFAAESAGVSNTAFTSSMERFSKRLGEAAQGTGAAARVLEQLGLNAQALADLGVERAFEVITDEIAAMESATERAATAAALFGREGVAMVNMLRQGSDAIRTTREEAREMGAVIGEDTVRAAEALEDELGRLKGVISAQFSEALVEVGPLLVGMAEGIASIASAANDAVSAVSNFASGIIESMANAREQLRLTREQGGGGPGATRARRGQGDGGGVELGDVASGLVAGTDISGEVDRRGRPLSPQEIEERARRQAEEQARIALDAQRDAHAIYQEGLAEVFSGGRNDFTGLPNQERMPLDDIVLDGDDGGGGGGGGGGGARNILDAITPTDEDIESMREQFQSAEEVVRERYAEQLAMVDAFYAEQEGKAEEHARMRTEIERRMQAELAQIRMAAAGEALGATSQMFEALAQAAGQGGERLLRVSKILSAAQAFVNTLAGASEALRLPFPANLAAAAKVMSTGLGLVAAIRGTSSAGGGATPGIAGTAVNGSEGQQTVATDEGPRNPNVSLTLIGDQGFSRAQIVQIAEALNDSTDEGQLVEIRGRR